MRKLAAIMFTDIVGYSALMSKDESLALQVLDKNREIQMAALRQFNGEFIKEIGDGTLSIFQSSWDAVSCALEIQKITGKSSMTLRIGIHMGDVVISENDVFGEGVNIASRIESLGKPGCIFVSERVYEDMKNKKGFKAEYVGEKSLKNINHTVRIYSITTGKPGTEIAELIVSDLTDKKEKSIVVLPFDNLSPDPDQEYFSDGLTEEVISDLSNVRSLRVISRSSAMTFKGTKKKIPEIAREVNVQYVLEGSVRKAGNSLRITAQLIDAASDAHLWAEKYSGTLDDVFDVQEKVSRSIVAALKLKLTPEESQKIAERPIDNVAAYQCYLKANAEIWRFNKSSLDSALDHLQKGLDILGDNALLYSAMAFVYWQYVNIGAGQEAYIAEAEKHAQKALALDPESPQAHFIIGMINGWVYGNVRAHIRQLKMALAVNPNYVDALILLAGLSTMSVGKLAAAIPFVQRVRQIDPLDPWNYWLQGRLFFFDGQYKLAVEQFRQHYQFDPENLVVRFFYAWTLAYAGQIDEAFSIIDHSAQAAPNSVFTKFGLLLKYGLLKNREEAFGEMTPDFERTCRRDHQWSYIVATLLALIDARRESLDWLENAVERGFINYPELERNPYLDNIREEERFKKLIERVKYEWEHFEV
ncbi:MAG: hypothetical protein NT175_09585 [Bacteroidetes bacterium]|nr:hypothetical protein [Bacteroidota bacterium]